MLKFYVSTRVIQIGQYIYGPQEQLERGFKGLDIKYRIVDENRAVDGRALVEIIIGEDEEYTEEQCLEYKAIVLEGLQAWSVHEKSLESAQVLAEALSDSTWSIVGDSLVRDEE